MTDKMGEKLMKFGPDWLRNNLSRDTTQVQSSTSGNSTASGAIAKNRITAKFKPAEYKYKRDDLLTLYRGKEHPPVELKFFKLIYVQKSQIPIGLQFCPRRVRAKRPFLPRCDSLPPVELKPTGNKSWNREHTRPQINYFQPRWLNESNWRQNHHLNKGPETDETWRNARQEYQKNRWSDKGKDRPNFQRPYSNDPWNDERHSPDDLLPEWANSEDALDETGTFDATGAFLPIMNNGKVQAEENNNNDEEGYLADDGNSVPESREENQEENLETEIPPESDNRALIDLPIPLDTSEVVCENDDKSDEMMHILKFVEESSYSMVEDYLNKLVQEDDMEKNRSKFEQNMDPHKLPLQFDPNTPLLPPMMPDFINAMNLSMERRMNEIKDGSKHPIMETAPMPGYMPYPHMIPPGHAIPKPTVPPLSPFESNGWYYQDHQDIIRGPYSAGEITEYCKAGFLGNFSLVRKGNGPHFIMLSRLFDLCGGVLPFLLSDHITTNIFNQMNYLPPPPFMPPPPLPNDPRMMFNDNNPNMNHLPNANKPSGNVKDFIDAVSLSMERRMSEEAIKYRNAHQIPENAPMPNFQAIHESMQFPGNVMLQPRPNLPPGHPFQHEMRIENTMAFDYNPLPYPVHEHGNILNMPPQLDAMPRHDWLPVNPQNIGWIEPQMPPKPMNSYVPIPMPISAHAVQNINQEPPSILSHPHDDYLANISPPQLPNTQSVVSSAVTNSPLWNNVNAVGPMESFDYNLSALAQRQKPIYAISPQQLQQPIFANNVQPPPYAVQEAQLVDHTFNPIMDIALSEKMNAEALLEAARQKSKEIKYSDMKPKGYDDKRPFKTDVKLKEIPFVKVVKNEFNAKPMLDANQSKQKKMLAQPILPFPVTSPPWNMKQNNIEIANSQHIINQMKFIENHSRENNLAPAFNKMHISPSTSVFPPSSLYINSANNANREKLNALSTQFTWASPKPSTSTNVISFAEIQAEEQLQHAKLEKSASAPRIFHSKNQQKMWSNSNESYTAIEGFWDTQSSNSKIVALSKSSSSNGQGAISKTFQAPPKVDKALKVSTVSKAVVKETKEKPVVVVEKTENNEDMDKFVVWAKNELSTMSHVIDVNDFVTFLITVESPYEVEEYAKVYMGDTKASADFAKLFIKQRSEMLFSKSRFIPCDDLCSPAPAYNPSVDKREESKNKNKKKKGKMSKIDARILGFNATASENRFNIGNIDIP